MQVTKTQLDEVAAALRANRVALVNGCYELRLPDGWAEAMRAFWLEMDAESARLAEAARQRSMLRHRAGWAAQRKHLEAISRRR